MQTLLNAKGQLVVSKSSRLSAEKSAKDLGITPADHAKHMQQIYNLCQLLPIDQVENHLKINDKITES